MSGDGLQECKATLTKCVPECAKYVYDIRSVVFGNGRPEKSLLVRMDRVEARLTVIYRVSLATLCGVGTIATKIIATWLERMLGV